MVQLHSLPVLQTPLVTLVVSSEHTEVHSDASSLHSNPSTQAVLSVIKLAVVGSSLQANSSSLAATQLVPSQLGVAAAQRPVLVSNPVPPVQLNTQLVPSQV